MAKVARLTAARRVDCPAPRTPRQVAPLFVEVADHLITEKLPLLAAVAELVHCAKTGRFPLRTVLLVAALAI